MTEIEFSKLSKSSKLHILINEGTLLSENHASSIISFIYSLDKLVIQLLTFIDLNDFIIRVIDIEDVIEDVELSLRK